MAAKTTETTKKAEASGTKKERRFEKSQLAQSKKLSEYRFVIDTILEDGKLYTMEEAEKLIDECLKREV